MSVNSTFIYMICQALHQPSYKFVHSLYVFCHYHYYKPTFVPIGINQCIYLFGDLQAGAFCEFVYVIVYNYVNVCTSHNNKPFTYLLTYLYHWCESMEWQKKDEQQKGRIECWQKASTLPRVNFLDHKVKYLSLCLRFENSPNIKVLVT